MYSKEAVTRFLRALESRIVLDDSVLIRRAVEVTTVPSRARAPRPERALVVCAGGSVTEGSSSTAVALRALAPSTTVITASVTPAVVDNELQVTDYSDAEDFERWRREFFGPSRVQDRGRDQELMSASFDAGI